MKTLLIVVAAIAITHPFAQAQKINRPQTAAAVAEAMFKDCQNYLQCSTTIAAEQAQYWKAEIDRMSKLGEGFKVCEFDRASFYYGYYKWFEKNRVALAEIDREFLDIDEKIKQKISFIQGLRVDVLPAEGQDKTSYPIGFQQIVDYLKNLNLRLKDQKPELIPALLKIQDNYLSNPLEVAHSQIIAAVEKTSTNLNVSLKEQGNEFSVALVQKNYQFDYILRYQGKVTNQAINLEISLFSKPSNAPVGMAESEKWRSILAGKLEVGGYPVDGQLRMRKMQSKVREANCKTENWDDIGYERVALPLVTDRTFLVEKADPSAISVEEFCDGISIYTAAYLNGNSVVNSRDGLKVVGENGLQVLRLKRDSYVFIYNSKNEDISTAAYVFDDTQVAKARRAAGCPK